MKDATDSFTAEITGIPTPVRKRGRPSTSLLTPKEQTAKRSAAYRARLAEAGRKPVTVNITQEVIDAIARYAEFRDVDLGLVVDKVLRQHFLRAR